MSCICTRKMVPLLSRTPQPVMRRSVSGFICVHLLEPILHIHSAWFSRKVVCCHTCARRKRCCLVCSSAACCLFVAQGSSCSSRDHTTLNRQTQVLPFVVCDAYPQEHAALLLRRARLLSCICTRKTVPLLFRTPQHDTSTCHVPFCLWNRYCTYTAHGFHARLFAVIHALEESVVASFAPQLLAACLLLRAVHVHLVIIPR